MSILWELVFISFVAIVIAVIAALLIPDDL